MRAKHEARVEATAALIELLQGLQGEDRTQLVIRFCKTDIGGIPVSPRSELIPFFVEVLRGERTAEITYATFALSHMQYDEAAPLLKQYLLPETSDEFKNRIWLALDMMSAHNRSPLHKRN